MFSTLSKTEIIIYVTFILSSANTFNLDKVKSLSFGNGLKDDKILESYLPTKKKNKKQNVPGFNLKEKQFKGFEIKQKKEREDILFQRKF